jgi:hypothetical protein
MNSLRDMGLTMGEYAEKLINEGLVAPSKTTAAPAPKAEEPNYKQLDISKTKVPDSFMKQLLGESYVSKQPNKVHKKIVKEETKPQQHFINEEKVDELISLLRDVKSLLMEMTTVGNIGTNLAGPVQKPKTKKDAFKTALRKIRK